MKLGIGSLLAASSLLALTAAQDEDIIKDVFEEEEDPILQDIWPRYFTTAFVSIPEGATENNSPGGFWQDGTYSTVQNQVGDQDLEIALTLYNPIQEEGYIYMQWIQVVDDTKTEDRIWYDSYTCTMEYKESALDNIDLNIFYPIGYKGPGELQYATGKPSELYRNEQTDKHPWIYVLEQSKITRDEDNRRGTETCAFKRDFETSLSDIRIKAGVTLKAMTGYKMYLDRQWSQPDYKGYSGETLMEWTIIEGAASLAATSALALALLLQF